MICPVLEFVLEGASKDMFADARSSTKQDEMIFVPGGTFAMGSNSHYPEEAPVHRVTVDGF
jgi:formylglycine-generating enzyme required for sulfatase activity